MLIALAAASEKFFHGASIGLTKEFKRLQRQVRRRHRFLNSLDGLLYLLQQDYKGLGF